MALKSSENLRSIQLAEKEILDAIVAVCNKHNIVYYLSDGTLLGAIRHQGFIPWDDDIDLVIPIDDYRLFQKIAQQELGDDFFIQNSMTDPNFNFAFTRVRKNNTTFMRLNERKDHSHHGLWVDIFPLIAVQSGKPLKMKQILLTISNFIQIGDKMESDPEEFKKLLGTFGFYAVRIFQFLPMRIRQKIHNIILNIVFSSKQKRCDSTCSVWGNITNWYPKDVFEGEASKVMFEGSLYNAPPKYEIYLHRHYGDYMTLPPEEERNGHGDQIIVDLDNSYEKYMIG